MKLVLWLKYSRDKSWAEDTAGRAQQTPLSFTSTHPPPFLAWAVGGGWPYSSASSLEVRDGLHAVDFRCHLSRCRGPAQATGSAGAVSWRYTRISEVTLSSDSGGLHQLLLGGAAVTWGIWGCPSDWRTLLASLPQCLAICSRCRCRFRARNYLKHLTLDLVELSKRIAYSMSWCDRLGLPWAWGQCLPPTASCGSQSGRSPMVHARFPSALRWWAFRLTRPPARQLPALLSAFPLALSSLRVASGAGLHLLSFKWWLNHDLHVSLTFHLGAFLFFIPARGIPGSADFEFSLYHVISLFIFHFWNIF